MGALLRARAFPAVSLGDLTSSSSSSSQLAPSHTLASTQWSQIRRSAGLHSSLCLLGQANRPSTLGSTRADGQVLRFPGASCCAARAAAGAAATVAAPVLSPPEVDDLRIQLGAASPLEIMDKALEVFGGDAAIAFSGAEDVALIELASLTGRPFRIFCLDTGRLNPETYRFLEKVRERYGVRIEVVFPEAAAVQELVQSKGLYSFYEDGHKECCSIRKVQPLRRALGGLRAWITGQRRDQSADTRGSVQVVELDGAFPGLDGPGTLVKFNPLARTPGSTVWSFLDAQGAPLNELHAQGYVSIGCEPCTRPVLPHQHEREGRWWWESAASKECGLHKASDSPAAAASAPAAAASLPAQAPSSPEPFSSSPLSLPGSPASASTPESSTAGPPAPLSREDQPWPDLYASPHVTDLTREQLDSLLDGDSSLLPDSPSSWLLVVYAPWCPHCQALEPALLKAAEALAGSEGTRTLVAKFRGDRHERSFVGEKLGVKSFPSLFVLRPQHALPAGPASAVGTGRLVKKVSERRDVDSLLRWVETLH